MASARLAHHSHHSHGPPPATSGQPAGTLLFQKSHVVAGVRDAYWSDDEEEEPECPLCVGEMDMDDLNFKPCPCGYQICRFCYHHIKENLNGRCPACRREYSDDAVEWTAMSPEDQKRLSNQKKQKEKEKKELEALKRVHLPNMRVVQRNVVYVTGLGPRFAKEELIPSLRSHEYFGQYGKISKIVLVKRSGTATREPTTGIYITYYRREDAARAIAGVDGSPSPGGGGEVMRASYGTTKYCMNFLRNITCTNPGCMELHEWGDEKDTFTKEDLATLKHALKDTETRQKYTVAREADSLPRGASWATKGASPKPSTMAAIPISTRDSRSGRSVRTGGRPGATQSTRTSLPTDTARVSRNADRDRGDREREREKERDKKGHAQTSSSGSAGAGPSTVPVRAKSPLRSSRPSTPPSSLPFRPPTATDAASSPSSASSPASSRPTLPQETSTTTIPQRLMDAEMSSTPPPTISTPAPPSESSIDHPYQLSGNVQALLDDVVTRRETRPQTFQSPFPDLDRTLAAFGNDDYSFSFNLDPKLIPPKGSGSTIRSGPGRESPTVYGGFDPFGLTSAASPSLSLPSQSPALPPPPGLNARPQPVSSVIGSSFASSDPTRNSYTGSFDPFAEGAPAARETPPSAHAHLIEDENARRGSRFGFAQKRASDSRFSSAAASPLVMPDNLPQAPLYASSDLVSPAPSSSQQLPQWTYPTQQQEFSLAQGMSQLQLQATALRAAQQAPPGFGGLSSFSPFGSSSSTEAALKEMLNIGRNQQVPRREPIQGYGQQGFNDPAIMSMRMSNVANGEMMFQQGIRQTPMMDGPTQGPFGGPPPGLVNIPPPGLARSHMNNRMANGHVHPSMQSLNAQQVSEYPPFPQFSPSTSAALVSPALAAISPLVSSSLPASSPVVASSTAAAPHTPAFSPSDFPELSSVPAERERTRRENSAAHSKKTETKANRKTSVSQTPALPSLAPVVPTPMAKQDTEPTSPPIPEQPSDFLSTSSTTNVKEEAETDSKFSPTLTTPSLGRAIVPLDLPATVPPLSRKQKRMQAKMQAKEKAAPPSSTHSMSTPASRVPSPPPASPPVTPQVSQEPEALADHSATPNHAAAPSDKSTLPSTSSTVPAPVTPPVVEPQEPGPASGKALPNSQPPSLKVAIGPSLSASQLSSSSPAPSEPDVPASAVTETAPESATTGLSKKQRKILAAKAAREAAEARALEAAKAQVVNNKAAPEAPHDNLASVEELLHQWKGILHEEYPSFFNPRSLDSKLSAPYAPLVDALTVPPVGNSAFTDGMPNSSSAISSFQQLLETLTQAISELLRLLPGITWADNSSFDSAILDILKAEDFMADGTHVSLDQDSDVETLTLALEKRAKWMKTQLTKLEELHRDINSAAVRAVLSLNDRGWDARTILNKSTGSLERFEELGTVQVEGGAPRGTTLAELAEALKEARMQESEVEMQLKEVMKLNALAAS